MVIQHDIVDLPLGLGEDVLNIGPGLGHKAIHGDSVEFSLQLEALWDHASVEVVLKAFKVVLCPDEFS